MQARSSSSRLPGKVFQPLPTLTVLEHCLLRLQKANVGPVYAVVPHDDQAIQGFLEERGHSFIAGPLDDVRRRFLMAAEVLDAEYIVRATADNPCVDPYWVQKSVEETIAQKADLFAYSGLPLGCAVEVFRTDCLANLRHGPEAADPSEYREHVSLHIKHHPELYRIVRKDSGYPQDITSHMRLTIDEPADLDLLYRLFEVLGPDCSVDELIRLYKEDPALFQLNRNVEQRRFPAHLFVKRHSA